MVLCSASESSPCGWAREVGAVQRIPIISTTQRMTTERLSTTLVVKLVAAWTLVGLPLAWGVWQVFKKSLDLFK